MSILIIFYISLLFTYSILQECKPKMNLKNCDPAPKPNYRYTHFYYQEELFVKVGCTKNKIINIEWSVHDHAINSDRALVPFRNKRFLHIEQGNIPDGRYTINVTATETGGGSSWTSCTYNYLPEPPVPLFQKGGVQYIFSEKAYVVNASRSINHGKISLEPSWSTECEKDKNCNVACPDVSKEKGLWLKQTHNKCHLVTTYKLSFKYGDVFLQNQQKIRLKTTESSDVRIDCEKNCNSLGASSSNPTLPIHLKLTCLNICKGFGAIKPNWEVANLKTGANIQQQYITKTGAKLIISKGSSNYGDGISIKASYNLQGISFNTEEVITMISKVEAPKCDINPKSGQSIKTVFTITCTSNGEHLKKAPPTMKLVQPHPDDKNGITLIETPFMKFETVIGSIPNKPQQKLVVKGHDVLYNEFETTLPEITITYEKLTEEVIDEYIKKMEGLVAQKDTARMTQVAQALANDLNQSGLTDEVLQRSLTKLVKTLTKVTVASLQSYKNVAGIIPFLHSQKNMPEEFKVELSRTCKYLSQQQLNSLSKSKYSAPEISDALKFSSILKDCANYVIKEDPIDHTFEDFTIATPADFFSEPTLTEVYPNYENVFPSPALAEIKKNAIFTIVEASKSVATTLANGEAVTNKYEYADISVNVDNAKAFVKRPIMVRGATVIPKKFKNNDKKVDIVITSYEKKILNSSEIVTPIVDVGFFDGDNPRQALANVVIDIILDVNLTQSEDFHEYSISVPAIKSNEEMDYFINIHRINLLQQSQCYVRFKDLELNAKLKLKFTKNRRPRYEDFKNYFKYIVENTNKNNSTGSGQFECPFDTNTGDSFVYVGVLPHDDMFNSSGGVSAKYSVEVSMQSCIIFDSELLNDWVPADCKVSVFYDDQEKLKIKCSCNHTSIFAGKYTFPRNKLEVIRTTKYETKGFVNYIIFIHVAIIFLCYCIGLCFMPLRLTPKYKTYFLCDNLKNDRYGYLILVETGRFSSAHTTSNIMIQVFGEQSISKKHVLNYPDPEKKLLQRSQKDYFVLTSSSHLGDIIYIHLWFDNIGTRPSWYCETIEIIDLQTKGIWHFKVRHWLEIYNDNNLEIKVEPTEKTKDTKPDCVYNLSRYLGMHLGAENSWNIFSSAEDSLLTYIQRLTVFLSTIYTTYLLVMIFIKPSTMHTSDAFGHGTYQHFSEVVGYSIGSSILSSLINFPYVYFFRNSEKAEYNVNLLVKQDLKYTHKVSMLTWCVLSGWIAMCMIYLVSFGFWVTYNTTYIWITCTILSCLLSIFVLEIIYYTVYNMFTTYFARIPVTRFNFMLILRDIEKQRKLLFKQLGVFLMRPYLSKQYHPLKKNNIVEIRSFAERREIVANLFKDMCMFSLYIFLLYIICLSTTDSRIYYSNNMMRHMLSGEHEFMDDAVPLKTISTPKEIYKYISTTLLYGIHSNLWYGNYYSENPGQMADFSTKMLGIVQLRQQRREQNCNVPNQLSRVGIICYNHSQMFEKWEFNNGSTITNTLGKFQIYPGEGYVVNLGRKLYNSVYIINLLGRHKWIDINTKVLLLEFLTYNANSNLFNAVTIIIERDKSGKFASTCRIFTTRILASSTAMEVLLGILLGTFIIITVFIFIKQATIVIKKKTFIFRNIWNIFDVTILLLSILLVYTYIYKQLLIGDILTELEESYHNEFVSYYSLIHMANANTLVSSILICLATIRLWKFLRFGRVFQVMEKTMINAASDIFILALYQIIIIFAFAIYFYTTYGDTFEVFSSLYKTITNLFLISLTFHVELDIGALNAHSQTFKIFYLSYMYFSLGMITIYTGIIVVKYEEANTELSNVRQYNIKNYWHEETSYYKANATCFYRNLRMTGGGGEDGSTIERNIYPKEISKRYAKGVLINPAQLRIMRLYALASLGYKKENGGFEKIFMAKLFLVLALPEDEVSNPEIFYMSKDTKNRRARRVLSDTRFEWMEYFSTLLLTKKRDIEINGPIVNSVEGQERLAHMKYRLDLIRGAIENIIVL